MVIVIEANENNLLRQQSLMRPDGLNSNGSSMFFRKAIDSSTDVWNGNPLHSCFFREAKDIAVAVGQFFYLVRIAVVPTWANGVDNVIGGQVSCGGDDGFADVASALPGADVEAGVKDGRASGPVNSTVHPATAQKRCVGCVDDGIDFYFGDVALL